jgi:hypothetical protein
MQSEVQSVFLFSSLVMVVTMTVMFMVAVMMVAVIAVMMGPIILVSIAEANQNFSRAARLVDENGAVAKKLII